MYKALRFVPDDTNIDLIGKRFFACIFSTVLIIVSVVLLFLNGLNFGIDFTGGTLIEIRTPVSSPSLPEMRGELNELGLGNISIQEFGQPDDLLIRVPEQADAQAQKEAIFLIKQTLADYFTSDLPGSLSDASNSRALNEETELNEIKPGKKNKTVDESGEGKSQLIKSAEGDEGEVVYRRIEYVGPQVGKELKMSGLLSILAALAGILVYVSFRFEFPFGVASLIALAHDAVATLGLFALTGMEFNLSTVAALLMIAGYSINDTVVVFDRIRENLRKYKKMPLEELFNLSINQTLSRTLITSLTTFLALFALWLLGGEVIRGFIDALLFGIVVGTYSSIFVASPVLLLMNIKRDSVRPTDEDSAVAAE